MKRRGWSLLLVVATTSVARAQPQPDLPTLPPDPGGAPAAPGTDPTTDPQPGDPPTVQADPPVAPPEAPYDPYASQTLPVPSAVEPPRPPINMPEVLTTPTGFLLPAAVFYTKFGVDTGGGATFDSRIGLGDVAEFGVATTDTIRQRQDDADEDSDRIQPYFTASFRLGVGEDRLFEHQPAVALGFRKSFETKHDGYESRVAELTLVASKHFGDKFAMHVGGAFWDASLAGQLDIGEDVEDRSITFHDIATPRDQFRPFGGIQARPLPRSLILVDLGWAPELCLQCSTDARKIRLRPVLSWGVRYEVAPWMRIESGVRVPDIGDANLLNAQIFGQVSFTSWGLRRAIDRAKK